MLDIRDLDHYEQIEWLRKSAFGQDYCRANGGNPAYLPDKLASDRKLVESLKSKVESPEFWQPIDEIMAEEKTLDITERDIVSKKGWCQTLCGMVAQVALLPLWIASLYPNIVHYLIPYPFVKADPMFTNSVRFIVPVVFGIPLFFLFTVLICGLVWGLWWQSIVWMLLASWPLAWFGLHEWKWMKATWRNAKLLVKSGKPKVESLMAKREKLFENLRKAI